MVEGGVEVIDSFLATDLVDRVVITISPRYTGGRRILSRGGSIPDLADVSNLQLGEDVVIEGTVKKHEKRHPVLR
jgi:riboflavin biosynthesis pyrimidine reductase